MAILRNIRSNVKVFGLEYLRVKSRIVKSGRAGVGDLSRGYKRLLGLSGGIAGLVGSTAVEIRK